MGDVHTGESRREPRRRVAATRWLGLGPGLGLKVWGYSHLHLAVDDDVQREERADDGAVEAQPPGGDGGAQEEGQWHLVQG